MAEKPDVQSELQAYMVMNLEAMRSDRVLTDAILVCDKQEFPVHRAVLASSCHFFYDVFTRSDNVFDDNSNVFDMDNNINADFLSNVLDFIYTGKFTILKNDPVVLEQIMETANAMEFHLLIKYCCQVVLDEWENPVPCLMKLGKTLNMKQIQQLIAGEVAGDLNSGMYVELPQDVLASMLMQPGLVSEMDERVEKILKWVEHNIDERVAHLPELFNEVVNLKEVTEDYLLELPDNQIIESSPKVNRSIGIEIRNRLRSIKSCTASTLSSRCESPFQDIGQELIHDNQNEKDKVAPTANKVTLPKTPLTQKLNKVNEPVVSVQQSKSNMHESKIDKANGLSISVSARRSCNPSDPTGDHGRMQNPPDPRSQLLDSISRNKREEGSFQNRGNNIRPQEQERGYNDRSKYDRNFSPRSLTPAVRNVNRFIPDLPNMKVVEELIQNRNDNFPRRGTPNFNQRGGRGGRNQPFSEHPIRTTDQRNGNFIRTQEKDFPKTPLPNNGKKTTLVTIIKNDDDDDEPSHLHVFTVDEHNIPVQKHVEKLNNDFPGSFSIAHHDECLYFVGGANANWEAVNIIKKYDVRTKQWEECSPMKYARYCTGSVFFQNNLYVVGGNGRQLTRENIVERYDPKTNTWTTKANTINKYDSPCAIATDDRLIIFGGYKIEDDQSQKRQVKQVTEASCEIYDPRINQWSLASTQLPVGSQIKEMCFCTFSVAGRIFAINKAYSPVKTVPEFSIFEMDSRMDIIKRHLLQSDLKEMAAIGQHGEKICILDNSGKIVVFDPVKDRVEETKFLQIDVGYAVFLQM